MKSIVYITNYSEKTNPQSYNNPAGVDNLHVTHKDALAFQIHVTDWAAEVWQDQLLHKSPEQFPLVSLHVLLRIGIPP